MAGYETIYNEWLNRNNLKTLWDAIVDNFIHAAPASKGDMMYWNAASTGGQGNIPTQPSHLTIGSAGQFLGVVIDGSGRVPQWQTFSQPDLTFTEAPSPTLKISVQGIDSDPKLLPFANGINGGIVSTVAQLFAGDKTFLGHIHGSKNIEADWGVAAYGIASLSHGTGGGGGGTVTGIMYDGDLYTPTSGIIALPNDPSKIAWDSSYQALTSTQKTNLLNLYAKAPSELWTQGNQLADKSFVNSSIATATATFRGTVTATNDTDAAAAAALATISTKDLNDYAFVRVADTPNVGVDKYKRYKWNGSSWEFEYTLNNSSFTAPQWASINSGITITHVTKLDAIESGAQVNIIESIKRNGTALTVTDKTVDISVPTALSQLTDDSTHRLVTDTQKSNWTEAYNAVPILSNSIGQVAAIAGDNSENIVLIDGRVTDLEGYFSDGSAKTATKFSSERTIQLTSHVTGSASSNGENGWSIATTISDNVIENKMIKDGTIQNVKLVNSSITLNGSAVLLGGTRTINVVNGTGDNADKIRTDNGAWMTVNYASTTGKLKTAVKINNTDFDGSQAITTALWGTARNIRITDADNSNQGTQVSVNGSTDYSLPLPTDIKVGTLLATELVKSNKNIEASWGVSAMGIADLTMSAGGGGGTVTGIKYNSSSTIYTPTGGIITLPDSVSGITWDAATRKIKVGINGGTQTDLVQFGTAAMHAHGDYATAVTISGTNLSVTNGDGTAVTTAINAATLQGHAADYFALASYFTNGVANNADKVDGHHASEFVGALGVSGNNLTWTRIGGTAQNITIPYATNAGQLGGVALGGLFTLLANDNKQLSATIGGVNKKLTLDYAKQSTTLETEPLTNQEFIFRNSPKTIGADSLKLDRILGRTLVWNQIFTPYNTTSTAHGITISGNGSGLITITSNNPDSFNQVAKMIYNIIAGHIYYCRGWDYTSKKVEVYNSTFFPQSSSRGRWRMAAASSGTCGMNIYAAQTTPSCTIFPQLFDLTLMFGSGNEPTMDEFDALYPDNKSYTEGQLINNSAEGLETVGFNLWDEEWEVGFISNTGGNAVKADAIRSRHYFPCIGGVTYHIKGIASSYHGFRWYDENRRYISMNENSAADFDAVAPANARYFRLSVYVYNPPYKNDICVNISDPAKNGQYEPYKRNVLDLHLDNIQVKSPNIWDEEWESGTLRYQDGEKSNSSVQIVTKNFVPVIPGATYYLKNPYSSGDFNRMAFYDANKIYLGANTTGWTDAIERAITVPTTAYYCRFTITTPSYNKDICFNISDSGFNGKYFPHGVLTFNGLKQAGDVRDEIVGGKYIRRVGNVDLGTQTWVRTTYQGNAFFTTNNEIEGIKKPTGSSDRSIKLLCPKFYTIIGYGGTGGPGNYMAVYSDGKFAAADTSIYTTSTTTEQFKSAMQGVMLNYELATYETYELVSPIPTAMPAGTTERRLPEDTSDSVLAPFACDMTYGTNPGDIARDLNNMWHIQGDMQTRLDGISISHYKTTPSLALEDNHVVQEGNNKLYIKFHATEGDATTNPQTLPAFALAVGTDNDGEHEETFSFGTVTEADILAICHL